AEAARVRHGLDERATPASTRRAHRWNKSSPDRSPYRPAEARARSTGHYPPGHRTQHARRHESGRPYLLPGAWRAPGRGRSGAGKSTVLPSIFGFTKITGGSIRIDGRDITRLRPSAKLKHAGIAYVLQDSSVFPDMTVEENLWMGGYLLDRPAQARAATESI